MPKKFRSCVRKLKRAEMKRYGYEKYNPYAVCRKSTGYKGSTHHKKRHHGYSHSHQERLETTVRDNNKVIKHLLKNRRVI